MQSISAFVFEPLHPLTDGLGVDLEPFRCRFHSPTLDQNTINHCVAMSRRQTSIRVLRPRLGHELLRLSGEWWNTHSSLGELTPMVDHPKPSDQGQRPRSSQLVP